MRSIVMPFAMLLVLVSGASRASAQPGTDVELYHVRFVKAAPGKIAELVEVELKTPPSSPGAEPPVLFRHAQGDDWHLMILEPLGKDETIRVEAPSAEMQQSLALRRTLSVKHADTFVEGPAWAQAKKLLLGDGQPGAVFIVTAFEPVPGHREQLTAALGQSPDASSTVVLQHREGEPWQLLSISRYASWTAFGEAMQRERAPGSGPTPTAEHIASHHDTIVQRVTAPVRTASRGGQ